MKKVFWTSIVWIVLFGWFALYMKWFNPTLWQIVTKFIYPGEECPVLQCDTPACEPCECEWSGQQLCPEVEPAVCNCPAQILTWENLEICTNLSEQLDRIEKKLSWTTASTEKSEEELFEEFKARRESKEE